MKERRSEAQEKDGRMWTQAGWKGCDMREDQAEDSPCALGPPLVTPLIVYLSHMRHHLSPD